jgi:hypothetical protein
MLDEFLRFRHLVRNVYTMNLVPDKMAGLMSALPGLCGPGCVLSCWPLRTFWRIWPRQAKGQRNTKVMMPVLITALPA